MSRPDDIAPTARLPQARQAALRALAMRPYSAEELRTRLRSRFGEDTANAVISELLERRLLDDAAYAESWRSSRERWRPRSSFLVRRELEQRGVAPELAQETVSDMDDRALAMRAAEGPARRLAAVDDQAFTRRLAAYLGRRGFNASVVYETVAYYRVRRIRRTGEEVAADTE